MSRSRANLVSDALRQNVIYADVTRFRTFALVDTGAYFSIISRTFLIKFGLSLITLQKKEIQQLAMADGKPINLIGKAEITVKINGLTIPYQFRVLPNF